MRTKVLAVIAAATLLLSACGQGEEAEDTASAPASVSAEDAKSTSLDDVTVKGKVGEKPKVSFEAPLVVDKVLEVDHQAKASKVADGEQVTAWTLICRVCRETDPESSYDSMSPAGFPMDMRQICRGAVQRAFGREGRVACCHVASMASHEVGSTSETLVYVIDIKRPLKPLTRAEGKKVDQSKNPVTVKWADNGEPSISKPKGKAPKELESYTTIEGEGPKVKEGQKVAVQYSGWLWEDNSKYFDSSWQDGRGPFAC